MDNRYNIGYNSYSERMNEKTLQYASLVRRAEILNRDNGGKATKEEGQLYRQAADVCAEIINMNMGQSAVRAKWTILKQDCEAAYIRIAKLIAPPPPPPAAQNSGGREKVMNRGKNGAAQQPSGPQTTTGGFTTKNACKEVPAETIEKWFKQKPRHTLADVTGMEEQKALLMEKAGSLGWDKTDAALGISPVQSFFFYGPPGTGKTFLIEAFAGQMMDKGFKFIRLLGGDIHASLVGVAEKTVQIAFQEAIDNEPCIIFIDEIENVCVNRSSPKVEGHETRLTVAFLEAYNLLKEAGKRVIFMGATNYPDQVDEAMLDRITMVRIPLPDPEIREQYFGRKFKTLQPEEGFTIADMAEATDNYSFRDLDRLMDTLFHRAKQEAIKRCEVLDENGEVDVEQTDDAASAAIARGEVCLTREDFEKVQQMLPPSNKATIRAKLDAFEARIRGLNQ